MSDVVHEIRNHLAIAVATIEGIRDEIVAATPARLDTVLHALSEMELLVSEFAPTDGDLRAAELAHAVLAVALRAAGPRAEVAVDYAADGVLTIRLTPASAPASSEELETELGVARRLAEAHGVQVERHTDGRGTALAFRLTPVDL